MTIRASQASLVQNEESQVSVGTVGSAIVMKGRIRGEFMIEDLPSDLAALCLRMFELA
ncbi:MAG TPA: hypothetical protein VMF10_15970 [Candidatus Aquilonibacter sp.]|nr:hypothetical protein [Candidatus Aquilonibacter sp.]